MSNPIGLYLHVPFCDAKCPYCDFYSMRGSTEDWERYTESIISHLYDYQDRNLAVDSVYFGGGTPSLLGAERLGRMLEAVRGAFALSPEAEITVEVNPTREPGRFFEGLAEAGVTRVSIGLQSAQAAELRALGRRHTAEQAAHAVALAHRAGIANVSLDLMLAVPGQTVESLRESVRFCAQAGVTHVSAYLLKIEPGTAFYARRETLPLPDEDGTCDLYLEACAELEACGFAQYEISNFALPGFESRHNLKYWRCEEYLGLGPAAHSFLDGRRFYYPRDLAGFLRGDPPVADGPGGGFDEFAMLALRLTEGLREESFRVRFGYPIPEAMRRRAAPLGRAGYCRVSPEGIALTRTGFLVSNAVIGELLA